MADKDDEHEEDLEAEEIEDEDLEDVELEEDEDLADPDEEEEFTEDEDLDDAPDDEDGDDDLLDADIEERPRPRAVEQSDAVGDWMGGCCGCIVAAMGLFFGGLIFFAIIKWAWRVVFS